MNQRNILILFLALLLGVASASAQYKAVKKTQVKGTDIWWEITADGTLRVTGTGAIPNCYYDKLTDWRKALKKGKINAIEIGEGITDIGYSAFDFRELDKTQSVRLSLPKSLKRIELFAFRSLRIDEIIIPEGVKVINEFAFVNSKAKSVSLPQSLKIIGQCAFENLDCATLVIPGKPRIYSKAFANNENLQEITFLGDPIINDNAFYGCTNLTKVIINDNPDVYWGKAFEGCKKLVTFEITRKFTQIGSLRTLCPSAKIYLDGNLLSPLDEYMASNDDGTVTEFIDSKLPAFDKFVSQKIPGLEAVDQAAVKASIESDIATWQEKGKYESTAKWQARVNESTRRARVDSLTHAANTQAARVKADYDRKLPSLKKEYESLRQKYAKEFYAQRSKRIKEFFNSNGRWRMILKPYDADHETFMISSVSMGDILLPVPVAKAQRFEKNWEKIMATMAYDYAPKDERDVVITKITFTDGADTYVYDGTSNATYALAVASYNFAPLEISNLSVADFSLPQIGGAPAAQTVATAPKSVAIADVDANIPVGIAKRDNTFALVIANENYRRVSKVPYAANDGKIMAQYLHKTLGIPEKNIHTVTDAALNDMRYELKWLRDVSDAYGSDASVIVYYAGHGVPDNETLDAYLLPVDGYAEEATTSGLSLGELQKTLSALPAANVTLLLDACFSGVGREGNMLAQARGVALKPKTNAPTGNLVVMSASQGTETAHPYEEKSHGLFTYFLLKKLGESKGSATLGEIADYVTAEVKKVSSVNGKRQTPSVLAAPGNHTWTNRKL